MPQRTSPAEMMCRSARLWWRYCAAGAAHASGGDTVPQRIRRNLRLLFFLYVHEFLVTLLFEVVFAVGPQIHEVECDVNMPLSLHTYLLKPCASDSAEKQHNTLCKTLEDRLSCLSIILFFTTGNHKEYVCILLILHYCCARNSLITLIKY